MKTKIKEILNNYNSVVEYAGNACGAGDIVDRIEEELGKVNDRVGLEDRINMIMQYFVVQDMNDDDSEYEDCYTNEIAEAVEEHYGLHREK